VEWAQAGPKIITVQGLYYLITGVWPVLGIEPFTAAAGPGQGIGLAPLSAALTCVIGLSLVVAATGAQVALPTWVLSLGSTVVLASLNLLFTVTGDLPARYLLEAALEFLLLALLLRSLLAPSASGRLLTPITST